LSGVLIMKGIIKGKKVIVEDEEAKEYFDKGWYGNVKDGKLELSLVEALLLQERGRLEVYLDKKMTFADFYHYCCSLDKNFTALYYVYKDLRERGLPVRIGFKGMDFRVYERGAKPSKAEKVKWIVFVASEDYPCKFDMLEKATKLSQNIRTAAVWAVVDDDTDITYYLISELKT